MAGTPGAVGSAEPMRVLVVDDTPDLRVLMRMALERSGDFVVVAEAEDGNGGVQAAAAEQPDVVFLDIAMPVMDGLEALPIVRAVCPMATIVMLSGFGAPEMTSRAMAGGADGYIQKGQPLSALLSQVRTLVARADSRRRGRAASATDAPVADEPVTEEPAADEPVADPLDLAPFGFLHVRHGRIVRANREACRLLSGLTRPAELESVAPELAARLLDRPGQENLEIVEVGDPPRRVAATVRHTGADHLVYLQAQSRDEANLLRRAIATAAHEIRGPVGVLMGVAETLGLHRHELSDAEHEHMMDVIGRQTRVLDNITADLLAAGQARHGNLALQLERMDATALVRLVIDDTFDLELVEDGPAHVLTDPLRFQQMLSNLLTNAHKYGAAPYLVRVTSQGSQVRIDVEDSGSGVPEAFRRRLFTEYARAPGTTARGTGLGLFVVRALAEAQGGSVGYSPREPHGSVFTLRLPSAAT